MEDEIGISIIPTEDATQSQGSFNKIILAALLYSIHLGYIGPFHASDLKQKVKLSFCFTVFDQVVIYEQNSNM